MVYLLGNKALVAIVLDQQRPGELMAVARLELREISVIPRIGRTVKIQHPLRRHEIRVIVIIVPGEIQEHRPLSGTVRSRGITQLEYDFVGCVIGPEVLEEALGGSVVLGGAGETEGAGIDHPG